MDLATVTYSNLVASKPLSMADVERGATAMSMLRHPIAPEIRVVEVHPAMLPAGRWWFYTPGGIVLTSNPKRLRRAMRRCLARKGTRGRRGARQV